MWSLPAWRCKTHLCVCVCPEHWTFVGTFGSVRLPVAEECSAASSSVWTPRLRPERWRHLSVTLSCSLQTCRSATCTSVRGPRLVSYCIYLNIYKFKSHSRKLTAVVADSICCIHTFCVCEFWGGGWDIGRSMLLKMPPELLEVDLEHERGGQNFSLMPK